MHKEQDIPATSAESMFSLLSMKMRRKWRSCGPSGLLLSLPGPSLKVKPSASTDHQTFLPGRRKSGIRSKWLWTNKGNFFSNVEFSNVRFWGGSSLACLLIIEFCLAIVCVWSLWEAWNWILSIALSTTHFGCLFIVFSDNLLRVPKVRSSCSGTIDFKLKSLAVLGIWTVILWKWFL